ncbi:hypothetical protein ACT29H_01790 [Thermophagus sp. OGC60D27]|uniref:hypothetical protein n=1 Tax=Thermophagus sp. OGC60D27 TaxID=3458415 RepID=UPI0040381E64
MKWILKAIEKVFNSRSKDNKIYCLTKYCGDTKLFFQFRKDGEDCFSVHRAGAWYFASEKDAKDARDFLGLYDLNIESFERI